MKYFLLLFLVGVASAASIYDASVVDDETARELSLASSFTDVLDFSLAAESDADKVSEIEMKVRKEMQKLKKYAELFGVSPDLAEKFGKLRQVLKEIHGRMSENPKELLEHLNNKFKDVLERLLDEKDKRYRSEHYSEGIREKFKKLKELLREKIDKEALKKKIEYLFGKLPAIAEQLLEKLKDKSEKVKGKLLDLIDRILGENEPRDERSLSEYWEQIKEYFKNIGLDIKEKYMKFGEWLKEKVGNGLEHFKTKKEKVKEITRELIKHAKETSKEVLAESLEFLRPFKEDLGTLYDQLKETFKDIVRKKD